MVRDWKSRKEDKGALKEATNRKIKKGTVTLMTVGNSMRKVTYALWAPSYTKVSSGMSGQINKGEWD